MAEEDLKVYSIDDLSKHTTRDDLWIAYNGGVYEASRYIDEHPGGEEVLLDVAGTDATEAFEDIGHSDEARETLLKFLIGKVEGGELKSPARQSVATEGTNNSTYIILGLVVVAVAVGGYFYFV